MDLELTRMIALLLGAMVLSPVSVAQQVRDFGDDCTSSGCHGKLVQTKFVHAPAGENQCDVCHVQPDAKVHRFDLTADPKELCMDCHEESVEGEFLHAAIEQNGCTICHNPHGSPYPKLLREATTGENCSQCHEEVAEDFEFHHGPVAAGACTSCHNPHASDLSKLLVETGPKLCAQCHDEIFENLESLKTVHQPAREDCLGCHQPHGGDDKMLLTATLPDLCLDCHDDVADAIDDAAVPHALVTVGRACLACHSPHASDRDTLLLGDGAQLCLSCHNRTINSKRGIIADIAGRLAAHPMRHGPVADNDCVTCHQPHGGAYVSLLTAAYPAKRYAAFNDDIYALCFECHDVEAFEDAETTDATGFRDGQRNLHFLHVNSGAKGRTCRFCHDPHANSNTHQVTDSVAFGQWRIPLNFEATQTGGSCGPGCHQSRRYDRLTPVNPKRKTPNAIVEP